MIQLEQGDIRDAYCVFFSGCPGKPRAKALIHPVFSETQGGRAQNSTEDVQTGCFLVTGRHEACVLPCNEMKRSSSRPRLEAQRPHASGRVMKSVLVGGVGGIFLFRVH